MSKQPPPAPIASAKGPYPTLIQISRTPRHLKGWSGGAMAAKPKTTNQALPSAIAPPDHPLDGRTGPQTNLPLRLLRSWVQNNALMYVMSRGWSGGAMVLGKLPVPGRPTIWITIGQGPTALAVGAGGDCFDIFTLICPFSPLSPSLWETARYRLQYCLKGPLNPKQPTSQRYVSDKSIYDHFII